MRESHEIDHYDRSWKELVQGFLAFTSPIGEPRSRVSCGETSGPFFPFPPFSLGGLAGFSMGWVGLVGTGGVLTSPRGVLLISFCVRYR